MSHVLRVADGFVNIRASFKLGPIDLGTQSSLVKRANGKWLMLDSVTMQPEVKAEIDQLTNNGADIEAILNLHPFHTLSCKWAHEAYPNAKLYGTSRHTRRLSDLPWQQSILDDPKTLLEFGADLDLRIPAGVDFISSNENVHFSSVVAYHPTSKTIHVDDTFLFIPLPGIAIVCFARQGTVQLHPTLGFALQPRKGAVTEFRNWMHGVSTDWADAENLCAAHTGALFEEDHKGGSIQSRLKWALAYAQPTLWFHALRYGA